MRKISLAPNQYAMKQTTATEEVVVGLILRPHGLRGLVKVRPLTDDPQRYFELSKVRLVHNGQALGEFELERVEIQNPQTLLVKFRGRDSIEAIEALRGAEIRIPRSECLPTVEDEYYHFDLLGLPVETRAGRKLGVLHEVITHPGNDIWVLHDEEQRELLLPAIASVIKEVNLKERRIVVDLLPGLLDQGTN